MDNEQVLHQAGEGNNVGLGTSAGTGGISELSHEGAIRRDDEIRVVGAPGQQPGHDSGLGGTGSHPVPTEHASNTAASGPHTGGVGGVHDGMQFGDKWDPASDIAGNVRRSQILAIASSRAEKGAQDELLPDRRSSLVKLDEERRYSASRDPESHDDRIRALAHSRSEAGHHQNELQPHETSSQAKLEREREFSESVPKDDIDGRIRALASSRSEKNSHQNELLPDRKSSIALAEDNRKHSMSYPAENPRKSSITPFVSEEKRQEARKASIGGLAGADYSDTDPKESARRSSVAAGLATYAAGTGQSLGSGQQDLGPSPLGTHVSGTDDRKVDAAAPRAEAGDAGHIGHGAGVVGAGTTAHDTHPGTEHRVGGVGGRQELGQGDDHHYGRDAAIGGAAVGATAVGAREVERKEEWKREQELEKQEYERAKEEKKREKEFEHEHKKHEKEMKKAEKEHEKEMREHEKDMHKAEKEHEKEVKKAEKEHEKEMKKAEHDAERHHHEREAAGAAAVGATGAGTYEYAKHHDQGAAQPGIAQHTSATDPATDSRLRDADVNRGPGAQEYLGTTAGSGVTSSGDYRQAGDYDTAGRADDAQRRQNREAAVIGAGAVGTTATAAYAAEQHHKHEGETAGERRHDDKDEKTEKRTSFLGGLFSRNKDDKDEKEHKDHTEHHDHKRDDKEERRREEHAKLLGTEREETLREEAAPTGVGQAQRVEDESKLHHQYPVIDAPPKKPHIASQQIVTDPITGLPKDMSKADAGAAHGTDGLP